MIPMKLILTVLLVFFACLTKGMAQDYIEDSVQEIETLINRSYAGRAREIAMKRLDEILTGKDSEADRKKRLVAYHKHLLSRVKSEKNTVDGGNALDLDGDGLPNDGDPSPLVAGHGGMYWHIQTFLITVKSANDEKTFKFSGAMTTLLRDDHSRKNHPMALMGYKPTSLRDRVDLLLDPEDTFSWNDRNKDVLSSLRDHLAQELKEVRVTAAVDVSFFNGTDAIDYVLGGGKLPVSVNGMELFKGSPIESKPFPAKAKYASLVRLAGTVPMEDLKDRLEDIETGGIVISMTGGDLSIFDSRDANRDVVVSRSTIETNTLMLSVGTHAGDVSWRIARSTNNGKTTVHDALTAINERAKKLKGKDVFILTDARLLGIAGIENSVDKEWMPFVGGKKVSSEGLMQKPLPNGLDFVLINKKRIFADFSGHLASLSTKGKDLAYLKTHAPTSINEWRLGQQAGLPEALFLIAECTMRGVTVAKDIQKGAELHIQAAALGLSASMNRIGEMHRMGMGMEMNDEAAFSWFVKASEKGDPAGLDNLGRCYFYGLGVERDIDTARDVFKVAADKGHAFAQYSYGNLLFAKRQFKEALPYFEKSSRGGCVPAIVRMGDMYRQGLGVTVDEKKAFELWNQAAKMNEPSVYEHLARAYENGWGVKVDEKNALALYTKAWNSGNRRIGPRLADMYLTAKGTPRDPTRAFEIYKVGAELGDGKSMIGMAELMLKGDGTPINVAGAEKLLVQAAEKGFPEALMRVGEMYEYGRGVKRSPERAFKYYLMAKEKGSVEAIVRTGWMYESGQGVEVDVPKAAQLYVEAAENGSVSGARRAGIAYLKGLGVEINEQKAFELIDKAHQAGDGKATYLLVPMYEQGRGVKKSHPKALELVPIAAARGDTDAQSHLAYLYYAGKDGYAEDMKKALHWYSQSANGGNVKAMFNIGTMYENGHGVGRDVAVAKAWYKKAADAGSRAADKALKLLEKK